MVYGQYIQYPVCYVTRASGEGMDGWGEEGFLLSAGSALKGFFVAR